ncbi:MAG: hypothetical protein AAF202_01950 [Pseudomonadota bacterium]
MERKRPNAVRILMCVGAVLMATTLGCTREMEDEKSSLTLKMPDNLSSAASEKAVFPQSASVPPWDGAQNPTTLDEINCYGVFVGGKDPDLQKNSCTSTLLGGETVFRFGRSLGFVPANSTVEIDDIPPGDIKVWIVGVVSADGSCREFNRINDSWISTTSFPHIIAEKQQTVEPGTNEVNMQAVLDSSRVFDRCDFIDGPGDGGGNTGPGPEDYYGDGLDGSFVMDGAVLDMDVSTYSDTDITRSGGSRGGPAKIFSANHRIVMLDSARTTADITASVDATNYQVDDEIIWHVSAGYSFSSGPDVQPTDVTPTDPALGACGGGLYMGSYGFAKVVAAGGNQLTLDQPIGDPGIPLSDGNNDSTPNIMMPAPGGTALNDNAQNFCIVQLRRVPQIDVLTATGLGGAEFYPNSVNNFDFTNGIGGIIAMRIRRLEVDDAEAFFDTTTSGFGGLPSAGGRGFLGQFSNNSWSRTNGNGGGGDLSGGGGGGGSNAGAGGNGSGGATSGAQAITNCSGTCHVVKDRKFFLGGGGGGMGGGGGGRGGGAVLLFIGELDTSSGNLNDGALRVFAGGGGGSSTRGGGAAGTIHVSIGKADNAEIELEARGGTGTGGGGGGGGGAVEHYICPGHYNPGTENLGPTGVFGGNSAGGGVNGGAGEYLFGAVENDFCP